MCATYKQCTFIRAKHEQEILEEETWIRLLTSWTFGRWPCFSRKAWLVFQSKFCQATETCWANEKVKKTSMYLARRQHKLWDMTCRTEQSLGVKQSQVCNCCGATFVTVAFSFAFGVHVWADVRINLDLEIKISSLGWEWVEPCLPHVCTPAVNGGTEINDNLSRDFLCLLQSPGKVKRTALFTARLQSVWKSDSTLNGQTRGSRFVQMRIIQISW